MLRRTRLFAAMAVAATFLAPGLSGPAEAADAPKLLGKFDDWAAYTYGSGADRICYVLSEPRTQEPKGAKRGDVYEDMSGQSFRAFIDGKVDALPGDRANIDRKSVV